MLVGNYPDQVAWVGDRVLLMGTILGLKGDYMSWRIIVFPGPNRETFVDDRDFASYWRAWLASLQYRLAWPDAQVVITETTD